MLAARDQGVLSAVFGIICVLKAPTARRLTELHHARSCSFPPSLDFLSSPVCLPLLTQGMSITFLLEDPCCISLPGA